VLNNSPYSLPPPVPSRDVKKILIVEDEALLGWSMANALGRAGYDPDVVECGEDALRKFNEGPVDLVISDYHLPGMDGLELAVRIKTISGRTPLVLAIEHGEESLEEVGKSRMVDYFVEKPFNLNFMVSLVRKILNSVN